MDWNNPIFVEEVASRSEYKGVFDYPPEIPAVVTIKTGGRYYGAVSRSFIRRYPGVALPELGRGDSSDPIKLPDGKVVIFTAQWVDDEPDAYPPVIVYGCTASSIRKAAMAGYECVVLPPMGGGEKRHRRGAMGKGILDALELLEKRDLEIDVIVALGKPRNRQRG